MKELFYTKKIHPYDLWVEGHVIVVKHVNV